MAKDGDSFASQSRLDAYATCLCQIKSGNIALKRSGILNYVFRHGFSTEMGYCLTLACMPKGCSSAIGFRNPAYLHTSLFVVLCITLN